MDSSTQQQTLKRPSEEQLVPDTTKYARTEPAAQPVPTQPPTQQPLATQFSNVGATIDSELSFLTSKLQLPSLDKNTRKIFESRINELKSTRGNLYDISQKLVSSSGDAATEQLYTQQASNLLYQVNDHTKIFQGQFSSIGSVIDTELSYLTNKLQYTGLDKDSRNIYQTRSSELQSIKNELATAIQKMSTSNNPQEQEAAKQKIQDLLYKINENNQFSKLATDAAERLNVLQSIYTPKAGQAAGPTAIMGTALFSMPDLNNDGKVDEKDLRTARDTGTFDRNLAIRDKDGKLLLYSAKYDLNNLDKIGEFKYNDMKDFALKLAREGLDVGNKLPPGTLFSFNREGRPNYTDFNKWPDQFKQKYYDFVSERTKSGSGFQKLQAVSELVEKKPFSDWTAEDKTAFAKFQDAYVIADNNYGTYLVTRDSPQWNTSDAEAYNKQLTAGGNRYWVDHTQEAILKVVKPLMIATSVVTGVAAIGSAVAGVVASTIGQAIGGLGAGASLSAGSTIAEGTLAIGGLAGSASSTSIATTVSGAITGFANTVVATGGQNLVNLGTSMLSNLAPIAAEELVKLSVVEIAKAAGADKQTLEIIDAAGSLASSILVTGVSNIGKAYSSGTKLSTQFAVDTMKNAFKEGLKGPELTNFLVESAESLVRNYAPKYTENIPKISEFVKAVLNNEDLLPVVVKAVDEIATSTAVAANMQESASKFTSKLDFLMESIKPVQDLLSQKNGATIQSLLYSVGQDYILNQLQKQRGQVFTSPVEENVFKTVARESYEDNPPPSVGSYGLAYNSDTIKAYVDPETRRVMLGVRGTATAKDTIAWLPTALGQLKKTNRYAYDKVQIERILKQFPPEHYNYFISGHSLGGSIATELKREYPFIQKAMVYNSATAPKDIFERDAKDVKRIYYSSDILYNLQGGKLTASEVRGEKFESSDNAILKSISMVQGHMIDKFFVDDRRDAGYNY